MGDKIAAKVRCAKWCTWIQLRNAAERFFCLVRLRFNDLIAAIRAGPSRPNTEGKLVAQSELVVLPISFRSLPLIRVDIGLFENSFHKSPIKINSVRIR